MALHGTQSEQQTTRRTATPLEEMGPTGIWKAMPEGLPPGRKGVPPHPSEVGAERLLCVFATSGWLVCGCS